MRVTTSGRDRLRMSTLFFSSFGWSRNRSPRQSSSFKPCFCRRTPMDPSKITIRCLNSWSRRRRTGREVEVAVAMWTLKSTEEIGSLVPDRAPHLEFTVVVEQPPPAGCKLVDGRLALGGVDHVRRLVVLHVGIALEHHVAGRVEHVGEVVDRMTVRQPYREAVVGRDGRIGWDHRGRRTKRRHSVGLFVQLGFAVAGPQGWRELPEAEAEDQRRDDRNQGGRRRHGGTTSSSQRGASSGKPNRLAIMSATTSSAAGRKRAARTSPKVGCMNS